ncbi:hypothetical protein NFI96_021760, partial [Prochilodus magdalenae]
MLTSCWILLRALALLAVLAVTNAVTVELGHSATIPCHLNCSTVEWSSKSAFQTSKVLQFSDGKCTVAPEYQDRIECAAEKIRGGDVSLTIMSVVYNDRGWYYCSCDGKDQCDRKVEVLVPTAVNISVGSKATLPCYAETDKKTADSSAYVLWEKNEQQVLKLENGKTSYGSGFDQRATVSTESYRKGDLSLTFDQVQFSDSGLYRCSLKDGGYGHPDAVTLVVEAHQYGHHIKEGDSVLLNVGILPALVYFKAGDDAADSWMCSRPKDAVHCRPGFEQRVSMVNNSLMLSKLSAADSGTYTMKDVTSGEVVAIHKLAVIGLPSSKIPAVSISILCVVVIVVVLGALLWIYRQKQRRPANRGMENDEIGPEEERVHLSIQQNTRRHDAGYMLDSKVLSRSMSCLMANTTNGFCLAALLAIPLVVNAMMVQLGHRATISCHLNCSNVEWWSKGIEVFQISKVLQFSDGKFTVALEFKDRIECSEEKIRGGDVSLTISSAVYNDRGWYYCSCDGKDLCDKKIDVLVPSSLRTSIGSKATLPCYAETDKRTTDSSAYVLWEKNEQQVLKLENGKTSYGAGFDRRVTVSTGSYRKGDLSLTIDRVQFSDSGLYRCSLKDGGYGQPNTISLTVEGHQFGHHKQDGDSVLLDLFVLPPVMVYFKPHEDTAGSWMCTRPKDVVHCKPGFEQRVSIVNNSLMLSKLSPADSGIYTVTDVKSGEVVAIHKLVVVGLPSNMTPLIIAIISCISFLLVSLLGAMLCFTRQKLRKQPEKEKENDETEPEDEYVHLSIQQSDNNVRPLIPWPEVIP